MNLSRRVRIIDNYLEILSKVLVVKNEREKLISVIVPVYNEEDCLEELCRRLSQVFDSEMDYEFECVLVENGSTDSSYSKMLAIRDDDNRFKIVQLSRNFHMDGGVTAGLDFVTGDAAVIMTADLQDPPEVIPEFLRLWEQGFENVYGEVLERQGTPLLRRINSWLFYRIAGAFTNGLVVKNASDFRLVDRKVYSTVRDMDERNRFVRGLFAWSGFSVARVPVPRPPRFAGTSKAHFFGVLGLAIKGIFSHSYVPLRALSVVGFSVTVVSLIMLGWTAWRAIFFGVPFDGFGTLLAVILLGFGFMAGALGLIGEYIALIYEEVKRRPNFVVRHTVGFDD